MRLRAAHPDLPWTACLLALTALVGLLAGANPKLGAAAAIGILFVGLVLGNLAVGVALFAFLVFLALLPTLGGPIVSFVKLAGLLLALSWVAASASRSDRLRAQLSGGDRLLTVSLVLFLAWSAV